MCSNSPRSSTMKQAVKVRLYLQDLAKVDDTGHTVAALLVLLGATSGSRIHLPSKPFPRFSSTQNFIARKLPFRGWEMWGSSISFGLTEEPRRGHSFAF